MNVTRQHSIKCRVELHNHLDGAVRPQTIFDVAVRRGMELPVDNARQFQEYLVPKDNEERSLKNFLKAFNVILPVMAGDRDAIRQMAIEFCADQASQGVLYTETRYCPQILCNSFENQFNKGNLGDLTPEGVVECVVAGLEEGCKQYGVKVKSLLCCLRGHPEWAHEVVTLCKQFKGKGVVGIDISGVEAIDMHHDDGFVAAFQEAKKCGIHRTAHAGEDCPSRNIRQVLDWLHAERIGHGYSLVEDEELYNRVQTDNIHLELCPTSSLLTGACPSFDGHPAKRYIKDHLNFSINSDTSLIIGHGVDKEYDIVYNNWGLDTPVLTRATFNAAHSCFLPKEEKQELIAELKRTYGIPH